MYIYLPGYCTVLVDESMIDHNYIVHLKEAQHKVKMAGVQHHSNALLLKDSVGDKGGSLFNAFRKKKENVLRGSLLVGVILKDSPNPADGKPDYNYRLHNEEIFIHCLPEDIAPLTDYEFDLLCGIKSPEARFDAFRNEMMDWGSQLRVNDRVYVTLPSQHTIANQPCQAIIRWKGFLPSGREEGIQFGVEIIEEQYRGKGSTNGFFRTWQLFICDNDCGLFVALDRLAPYLLPAQSPNSLGSRLGLGKSNETRSSIAQSPSAGTRSQTQKKDTCQFKRGDRVVAYNKDQIPIHGTVKWTGEAYTDDGKINAVGIETNVFVQKGDFLIAFASLRNNFKCKGPRHGKVVLPESLVQLELEMIEEKQEKQSKQHEGIHCHLEQNEQEMLREAEIETRDLNSNEQEKLLQEYKLKQQKDDKLWDKNTVSNLNHPQGDASKTAIPRQFSTQEQVKATGPEINHAYEVIPRFSSTGETRVIDRAKHKKMLEEYNRRRGEKRKIDSETARNSSSAKDSSVDPPDYNPLPPNQSSIYQNMQLQSDSTQFSAQEQFAADVGTSNPYNLRVGSAVQISTTDPTGVPHYGVIRWIGTVAGANGQVAGIELEIYLEGCNDGTVRSTGEKFFDCPFGKGLYFPLASLTPDRRFFRPSAQPSNTQENPVNAPMEEEVDQFIHDPAEQMRLYIGNAKGIQGHQNSCYLDSTIFGLFALSDNFDTMFLEPNQTITSSMSRTTVSQLLWKGIVNPLRKYGVVRYESVMMMRNALDQLGKMEGITEKEKDPEEFLNMLFKLVLHTKPFISIRRPFGVEKEFFVQLFVEQDPNDKIPTVGRLLKRMFKEQWISFTKVPSKLLIQVPRFGRGFKTFQKVVPELKINIKELIETPPCFICEKMSDIKCLNCSRFTGETHTFFCNRCFDLFHKNKAERGAHKTTGATETDVDDLVSELDLLSVICIEVSHYVCFTRDPRDDTEKKWIFFNSMADRQYDRYNIPRVTDCTCELNEWVYSGDRTRLMSTQPRQLPELVRRFTQDIYMCVYIQPDVAIYGDVDEGEEDKGTAYSQQFEPSTHVSKEKLLESKLQQRVEELQQRLKELQQRAEEQQQRLEEQQQKVEELTHENAQCIEQADQQKHQLIQQMQREIEHQQREIERQRRENENRLANKEERIKRLEIDLQQKADSAPDLERSVSRFTKVQIPRQDQDSWNVQRREVVIQGELGHGAWGSVYKGVFRGRQVAVKKAHRQILHETTIDQLIREIRIMAHVQHPNLVRLIAAVVDEGVERRTESPLVVLELMETDLRSASREHDFKRVTLLSIFRDVAYALHYLHEHQEPIIHRDVSAPNVLLQRIYQDIWRAKLSDFGSANLAKHCKTAGPGAIVYAAPETFPNIDPPPKQTTKIDVYSYGYLLVESITKKMPSRDKRDAMLSTIKEEWAPMYYLIIACTNKEPERRLTMSQVLERLHSLSNE